MNYTPNIRKSSQTFVSVLQKAKDWFASLSKTEQQNLIDDLEHVAAHLAIPKSYINAQSDYQELTSKHQEQVRMRLTDAVFGRLGWYA